MSDGVDWEAYGRDTPMSEVHLRDEMHAHLLRDFVEFFADWDRDAYILDVGCGDGYWMETLRNLGFRRVVGFDSAQSALERAAEKGLDVRQGDIYDFDVANAFDVILLCDTLEHLPDVGDALRRVHRALRTHGCLYLTAPVYESLSGRWTRATRRASREDQAREDDPTHLHAFASSDVLDVLEALNFSIEGSAHLGARVPWRRGVQTVRPGRRFGDWVRVSASSLFKVHGPAPEQPSPAEGAAPASVVSGVVEESTVPTAGAPSVAPADDETDIDDEPGTVLAVD